MEAEFRRVEVVVSAQAYRDQRCFRVHGEEEREITGGPFAWREGVCVCVCGWKSVFSCEAAVFMRAVCINGNDAKFHRCRPI